MAITQEDFETIIFGFSYIKALEFSEQISSEQISRTDSVNAYLEEVLTLERSKSKEKEAIIGNLEEINRKQSRKMKKEKLKNVFIQIGAGLVISAEAGVITYLLLK